MAAGGRRCPLATPFPEEGALQTAAPGVLHPPPPCALTCWWPGEQGASVIFPPLAPDGTWKSRVVGGWDEGWAGLGPRKEDLGAGVLALVAQAGPQLPDLTSPGNIPR